MSMFDDLVRDPQKVHSDLVELADGRLITKSGCKIYIPSRFAERDLAYIGLNNYIVGIYALVVNNSFYAVSTINAMINIDPTDTKRIKIDDTEYIEFIFAPGSTVIKSLNLVKIDVITYKIYDEIFYKGRIPIYMNYDDLGSIFDTAKYHAGANIGESSEVTELIASIITRDPDNKNKYYRTKIKTLEDARVYPPAFIPLKSVSYAATNTITRLGGSYFDTGVISSLVSPSDREERLESLLKS